MTLVAKILNKLSGGYIRPSHITTLSLLGHGLVVWALVSDHPIKAAAGILVFGLMDSLDGALARVQRRTSLHGMFFDAVSDRAKEVLIYIGLATFLSHQGETDLFWLVAAVAGSSQLVSYVKAKGEMAFAGSDIDPQRLNRLFSDGLGRYEVRMSILIAGLLFDTVEIALLTILILNTLTAAQRFIRISGVIKDVED
jgi:CDP-diacylglycerol--glycerol-3-phosphate 3-phosphatidyltransferase